MSKWYNPNPRTMMCMDLCISLVKQTFKHYAQCVFQWNYWSWNEWTGIQFCCHWIEYEYENTHNKCNKQTCSILCCGRQWLQDMFPFLLTQHVFIQVPFVQKLCSAECLQSFINRLITQFALKVSRFVLFCFWHHYIHINGKFNSTHYESNWGFGYFWLKLF